MPGGSIRTRTLIVPAGTITPRTFGERGSWLEVVDGGIQQHDATISLGLRGEADALTAERTIHCISGTVVVCDFDEISLTMSAGAGGTVVVRVGDGTPPVPVTGMPRVKWLAAGYGATLAAGAYATLVTAEMFQTANPMLQGEHFEPFGTWTGFVVSAGVYVVYEMVQGPDGDPMIAQSFDVRPITPVAGVPFGVVKSYACRMQGMGTRLDAWPAEVARVLDDSAILIVAGAAAITYSYLIGVKT